VPKLTLAPRVPNKTPALRRPTDGPRRIGGQGQRSQQLIGMVPRTPARCGLKWST
jgi:hypothetical protein